MAEKEREKGSMTTSEAGRMGGEKVFQERGREFYSEIGQKGGAHSWTASDEAKLPTLDPDDRRRAEEIRAKLNRGEELTTAEAGFLGGIRRVEQEGGGRGGNR